MTARTVARLPELDAIELAELAIALDDKRGQLEAAVDVARAWHPAQLDEYRARLALVRRLEVVVAEALASLARTRE